MFLRKISQYDRRYGVLLAVAINLVLIGTVFYRFVEGLDWVDAVYFSIVTLTTVGYGDFVPQTMIGKIFTIAYILIGVGVLASLLSTITSQIVEQKLEKEKRMKKA